MFGKYFPCSKSENSYPKAYHCQLQYTLLTYQWQFAVTIQNLADLTCQFQRQRQYRSIQIAFGRWNIRIWEFKFACNSPVRLQISRSNLLSNIPYKLNLCAGSPSDLAYTDDKHFLCKWMPVNFFRRYLSTSFCHPSVKSCLFHIPCGGSASNCPSYLKHDNSAYTTPPQFFCYFPYSGK